MTLACGPPGPPGPEFLVGRFTLSMPMFPTKNFSMGKNCFENAYLGECLMKHVSFYVSVSRRKEGTKQ